MKTDKLRELWKLFPGKENGGENYSAEDILNILKNRADISLRRLNRSIYLETFSTLLALILIVLYFSQLSFIPFYKSAQVVIIVLIVFYFGLLGWLFHRLNSVSLVISDLRLLLERKISILTSFIRGYFWMNMIIAPIVFPIAVFAGYFAGLNESEDISLSFNFSDPAFKLLLVITVFLILAFYPFLKWYIGRLYGRHVKQLKLCLDEITQMDES
jgi:hypothetical protein